ncbi:hypothetical protein AeMF1_013012 [Aphanomyces euteiches]|nr:hypothetical protein AeMF1_013012 [Aphanomyces euteiches]
MDVRAGADREAPVEAGDDVIKMRLSNRTRYQYSNIQQRLLHWLELKHPSHVVDGKIKLPLSPRICKMFLAHESIKVTASDGKTGSKYKSKAAINGCRSAIVNLHKESKVKIPDDLNSVLSDYMSGYKRMIAELKEEGEMPLHEGKEPIAVDGYRYLAQKALDGERDKKGRRTVHLFLLLCWNLIARTATVGSLRYGHVTWEGDAMVIRYGRMKNDQEGNNCTPHRVYANPENPFICPVLSMAVLVFSRGANLNSSTTLLFGANAKEKFSSWLLKTATKFKDELLCLGVSVKEVGTHSFRKGVASELSNSHGGPTPVSVHLRAGWTLGPVQGRYIFSGSGGDQFVGRAAAGSLMYT